RSGDDFLALTEMTTGTPNLIDGPYTYDAGHMHMHQADGTEIPLSGSPYPVFHLPPQQGRYRFTTSGDGTDSVWTFTSSHTDRDARPRGYTCSTWWLNYETQPCGADPLIFLRYDAHTAMDNTVTASAGHQLDITPYYQADAGQAAVLTTFKVWTSMD